MSNVISLDDRRALARPSTGRKLIASGVIRPKSDPRPSVRLAAQVGGAGLRVTHTPNNDPNWRPAA